jgi:hypothetical protein
MTYRLLLDIQVVAELQSMTKAKRDRLLDHLEAIRDYPERHEDYSEHDSEGRRVTISIFHGLAIHYWIDSVDRHLKVMVLETADGR